MAAICGSKGPLFAYLLYFRVAAWETRPKAVLVIFPLIENVIVLPWEIRRRRHSLDLWSKSHSMSRQLVTQLNFLM